jgi:hypothetical protein
VFDVENGTTALVPGGYQMDVVEQALWAYTGSVNAAEFYAELEVTPGACPTGQGAYGLVFHRRDDVRYRFFLVWCSGLYSLFQRETASRVSTLGEGSLPDGLDPSGGTHVLGIRVLNNTISLYVDNYLLGNFGALDIPAGDIGPYAETKGGPISVLFSRLAVYQAE